MSDEQPTPSTLEVLTKYSLIGGSAVAAVAYLGGPAGEAVKGLSETGEDFWGRLAHTVGDGLKTTSSGVTGLGETIAETLHINDTEWLSKEHAGRLAAIMAGGAALGGVAAIRHKISGAVEAVEEAEAATPTPTANNRQPPQITAPDHSGSGFNRV